MAGAQANTAAKGERLLSLDTYRGLIMVALAFNGWGLAKTAERHLEKQGPSTFWSAVAYQFEHAEWVGATLWDMIQPSFMFMVGVSLAYSYGKRRERGDAWWAMAGHAWSRALILCLLGIFLISNGSQETEWSLVNVLTQIGLGYGFLFLMFGWPPGVQLALCGLILAVTWVGYARYPEAGIDVSLGNAAVGVPAEWAQQHLSGVPQAWHKNANWGHALDLRLLNLLPRSEPFVFSSGGYPTINFLPSLATMLFGLMSGELLRSERPAATKIRWLVGAALAGLIAAGLMHLLGCPIIKRIWTPSWTMLSTGLCALVLAGLYGTIDVIGLRRWSYPLVVVGMNSIAAYTLGMLLRPWTARTLETHLNPWLHRWAGLRLFDLRPVEAVVDGPAALAEGATAAPGVVVEQAAAAWSAWGALWEPTIQSCLVGGMFWLALWWMYRQRIFIRL